jgi:hypothetical protein
MNSKNNKPIWSEGADNGFLITTEHPSCPSQLTQTQLTQTQLTQTQLTQTHIPCPVHLFPPVYPAPAHAARRLAIHATAKTAEAASTTMPHEMPTRSSFARDRAASAAQPCGTPSLVNTKKIEKKPVGTGTPLLQAFALVYPLHFLYAVDLVYAA